MGLIPEKERKRGLISRFDPPPKEDLPYLIATASEMPETDRQGGRKSRLV